MLLRRDDLGDSPLEFCVHGKWTRMVDVPHVGEQKYSFRYRGARKPRGIVSLLIGSKKTVSLLIYNYFLFLMKPIVSTAMTEECETRHPVNLACAPLPPSSCNTTIVLTIRLAIKVTTFSHFLSIYFLSNVFYLSFFRHNCFLCLFFRISFFYT